MVVYTGESAVEVRGMIENDIYATNGIWDLEKTEIIPVSTSSLLPLFCCSLFV